MAGLKWSTILIRQLAQGQKKTFVSDFGKIKCSKAIILDLKQAWSCLNIYPKNQEVSTRIKVKMTCVLQILYNFLRFSSSTSYFLLNAFKFFCHFFAISFYTIAFNILASLFNINLKAF